MSDKQKITKILTDISEDASYEDILYELYLQYRIEKGLLEVDQGKVKTSKELKEIFNNW